MIYDKKKRHINEIRAEIIDEKRKPLNRKVFGKKVFPDVSYNSFRGWFHPPIHLSDERLLIMENHLGITQNDIEQVLKKKHGLSCKQAVKLFGVKFPN